jgi:hypothetical protein
MKSIQKACILLSLSALAGIAAATCQDIQKTCHDAYILDTAACSKNYSGQQKSDCESRANRQFEDCVKGHGCPLK